ncbi:MAG: family N-acetyltransferase [Rhodospirillales bacterium]|nr:family N-acetyltransferase [Rhodospirillales bacterium]
MVEAVARHDQSAVQPLGHATVERATPSIYDGLRQNNIEVRIARTSAEIEAAQRLRYQIFYGEMNAKPTPEIAVAGRDFDRFDTYCEHLLVLDHSVGAGDPEVIGTYRLLRRSLADQHGGFYTATEFDISALVAVPGEIMELGRACVDERFRNRPTMQLLWRGIASYVQYHDIKIMFGCASLPGTDPQALARPLSYLHYNHLAPEPIRTRALPHLFVKTDLLPLGEVDAEAAVADLDARATIAALPPLIKGYLRLGGMIGEGAVIDHEFQTTDVCIIVVTDQMVSKYFNHFIRTA